MGHLIRREAEFSVSSGTLIGVDTSLGRISELQRLQEWGYTQGIELGKDRSISKSDQICSDMVLTFFLPVFENFRYLLIQELLPLNYYVRAKLRIMLKIRKFSKSFISHIANIK